MKRGSKCSGAPVFVVALLTLCVGVAGAVEPFSKPAARKAARAELRRYVESQAWAKSAVLGSCSLAPGATRATCQGRVRGGDRSCAVEVARRDASGEQGAGGAPVATVRRGRCRDRAPVRVYRLGVELDPRPQRGLANPFNVLYSARVTTTSEAAGDPASAKQVPPLSGTVRVFDDGLLACTVQVGGKQRIADCPIEYPALGRHQVTAAYEVGSKTASATMIDDLQPFGTGFTATARFVPNALAGAFLPACPVEEPCELEAGLMENVEIEIGKLVVAVSPVSPWGTLPSSACGTEEPNCRTVALGKDGAQSFQVWTLADLTINQNQSGEAGKSLDAGMGEPKTAEVFAVAVPIPAMTPEEMQTSPYYFRFVSGTRPGFVSSEASAPVQFLPTAVNPVTIWKP
jgi:hypothetical protein